MQRQRLLVIRRLKESGKYEEKEVAKKQQDLFQFLLTYMPRHGLLLSVSQVRM